MKGVRSGWARYCKARFGKAMRGMLRHSKSRQAKVLHGLGFTKVTLLLFKKGERYGTSC